MVRASTVLLGAVAVVVAGVAARSVARDRATPRVPFERVGRVGPVELRRYPPTVLAETVASDEREAFSRLFRYISGTNRAEGERVAAATGATSATIPMTAPVETGRGQSIEMTAPVETDVDDAADGLRMAFYLPAEYDYDTAPRPSDPTVRLVEVPARTLAVLSFSWWATDDRVARKNDALLGALADADVTVLGTPFLLRYDAPWTPPFLRTNEVAVEVRRSTR